MTSPSSLSPAQSAVNSHCSEIIDEIVNNGCLATTDFVIGVLLDRYRVESFRDLNVGSMSDIPVLALLSEIFRKV